MIALIATEATGTWLMATPELLLGRDDGRWATMALAGTMSTPGPWDNKNMREQAYVALYIRNCLLRRCYLVNQKPVHTTMAAKLYHLRTDFEFALSDDTEIVKVLDDLFLHPLSVACRRIAPGRLLMNTRTSTGNIIVVSAAH